MANHPDGEGRAGIFRYRKIKAGCRRSSFPISRVRLLAAVAVLGALLALAVPAYAAHTATAANSPPETTTNTSTAFTLTVSNSSFSTDKINKVVWTVEGSFTVVAAGVPPTNWTVSVVDNVITWTADTVGARINPGSAKTFAWSATTGSAGYKTHTWTTTDDVGGTYPSSPGWVITHVVEPVDFNALAALALAAPAYLFWRWKLRRRRTSAGA